MVLVSRMVFKQPLDSAGALGISIMLVGTAVLNGFSRSPTSAELGRQQI
jgi:multidrug transporter EmrE-like cation transporter